MSVVVRTLPTSFESKDLDGQDVPVSFTEPFFPNSGDYHDLWGWIEHERSLTEEHQPDWSARLVHPAVEYTLPPARTAAPSCVGGRDCHPVGSCMRATGPGGSPTPCVR